MLSPSDPAAKQASFQKIDVCAAPVEPGMATAGAEDTLMLRQRARKHWGQSIGLPEAACKQGWGSSGGLKTLSKEPRGPSQRLKSPILPQAGPSGADTGVLLEGGSRGNRAQYVAWTLTDAEAFNRLRRPQTTFLDNPGRKQNSQMLGFRHETFIYREDFSS